MDDGTRQMFSDLEQRLDRLELLVSRIGERLVGSALAAGEDLAPLEDMRRELSAMHAERRLRSIEPPPDGADAADWARPPRPPPPRW